MQQQLTTAVAANKILQQQPSTSALHVCKVISIFPEQPPSTPPEQPPEQPPQQPPQQIETARTQPAEILSESINNIMLKAKPRWQRAGTNYRGRRSRQGRGWGRGRGYGRGRNNIIINM
ncbi:hypothetical protein RF55_23684 [Lasius niger]|uniref:Uncharacterized protein n=1 Tax=Lasius niger TaxID=67767 RepID=A0A0J7MNS0_LASNI|nr:hypothetical protein RF55_23684 [Lasius niger]